MNNARTHARRSCSITLSGEIHRGWQLYLDMRFSTGWAWLVAGLKDGRWMDGWMDEGLTLPAEEEDEGRGGNLMYKWLALLVSCTSCFVSWPHYSDPLG